MRIELHTRTLIGVAVSGCFIAALGGCGGGGGSDVEPIPSASEQACSNLATTFSSAGVSLTTAKVVAATTDMTGVTASGGSVHTGPMPQHCLIQGKINSRTGQDGNQYAIGFEVRAPLTAWNGRFYFQGGGGANGALATSFGDLRGNLLNSSGYHTDNALNRGYAVASTDSGHLANKDTSADASTRFGADPQARLDYGYNAIVQTTAVAKAVVNKLYGASPSKSYFVGCSKGGQEALMASQKMPNEYDGVYSMDPGFQLPQSAVSQAWDTQQFYSLSSKIFDSFTQKDLNYVASRVLAVCDSLDGATDGLIQDRASCDTAISSAISADTLFTTGAANSGTGLTSTQKTALVAVFGGAKDANGNKLYSDWPYDNGVNAWGWRQWKLGRTDTGPYTGQSAATQGVSLSGFSLPNNFMSPYFAITGDGPTTGLANALNYMLSVKTQKVPAGTVDPEGIYATSGIYTIPSMSKTQRGVGFMAANSISYDTFKSRGSKLVVVHGTADPVFSSNDTKAWYNALNTAYSGNAADFARYFEVPGMNHCNGGLTADKFDMFQALVNWVENGVAPDSVTATVRDQNYVYSNAAVAAYKPPLLTPGIQRPLCAHPKVARSTDNGATWACK